MNIVAQCCGLVILSVIIAFYQGQKKLELNTSKTFLAIWTITVCSLILDILSVVSLTYRDFFPELVTTIICKAYLVSIVWEALFALGYVCVDVLKRRGTWVRWERHISYVGIADLILIAGLEMYKSTAPATYTYGPAVFATYMMGFFVIVCIFVATAKWKGMLNEKRRLGVIVWGVLWVVASIIQFYLKNVLIVGYTSVIGILIIFITLENPEINLDKETGMFNLNAFFDYMKQLQTSMTDVSILCVSYDSNRNSTMSYDVEKLVNKQIAQFINEIPKAVSFRSSALEYMLVFKQEEYAEAAIKLIEKRFENPWGNEHMRLISVDWYYIETTEEVQRAEDILPIFQYAKQNRVELGNDANVRINNDIIDQMYADRMMENELIEAMAEERVEVFYQPIFSVKDNSFACAEALVRIRDKEGKIIPPGMFIDIAEKRGLIIKLGEYVFREVCKFLVEKEPQQYGLKYIEVNLSVLQCGYERLADDFIKIMKKYKVDPSLIVLEITESASIKEKNILLNNMKKLKEVGVKFALDDFGTGQSNLNYIVDMPVDVVKFDSSMTNAYFENTTAKYVMDAAMQMIQGMELEIVSEGIEEKEQYKEMKNLGIDYIQGYYFSKPVDNESFIEFIKENQ